MKNIFKTTLALLSVALLLNACDGQGDSLINDRLEENPLPEGPTATSGDTDFSNYVSIGNSLTAGYMDGALYTLGQQNSIANMLAGQFALTVEGDYTFNQPDINSEDGFNTTVNPNPAGNTVFGRFKLDTSVPGPSPTIDGDAIAPYTGDAVNNFGVPGIVVGQLLTAATGGPADPGNPAYNPFYARFASNPGTSRIIDEVIAAQPSFFSLWIGSNDVLGYAVSGASNEAILTSDANFDDQYNGAVDALMANTSADGVVIDIPFFLGLAYFQAVRWNNITLDEATASVISSGFESVNGAIQACAELTLIPTDDAADRVVSYSAGDNPILVVDEELTDLGTCFDALQGAGQIDAQQRAQLVPYEQSRPLTAGELVVLSAGSVLGTEADGDASTADTPIGVVIPLGFNLADGTLSGDRYYLTLAEQQAIEAKRLYFNGIIEAAADNYPDRLALYVTSPFGSPTNPCTDGVFCDIFGLSDGVPGITVDGVNLAPDFSPNGVLSTDGIHPNPRGNAIIANEIIDVIEAKFNAQLPSLNVISLPSVTICAINDCLSEQ
jgi:hypothetical protein